MRIRAFHAAALVVLTACAATPPPTKRPSPVSRPAVLSEETLQAVKNEDFLYLEEISGEKALAFARAHNAVSEQTLSSEPGFNALQERLFSIYSSRSRSTRPSTT